MVSGSYSPYRRGTLDISYDGLGDNLPEVLRRLGRRYREQELAGNIPQQDVWMRQLWRLVGTEDVRWMQSGLVLRTTPLKHS